MAETKEEYDARMKEKADRYKLHDLNRPIPNDAPGEGENQYRHSKLDVYPRPVT